MTKILIRGMRNGDTCEQLFLKLDRTRYTINGMYKHILNTSDSLYKEEALGYFGILIAAGELFKSLSLGDLACVEGEPQKRISLFDPEYFTGKDFIRLCQDLEIRLVACCDGFIEIDGKDYCHAELSNCGSSVPVELTNSNCESFISAESTNERPKNADKKGRQNEESKEYASIKAMIVSA